MQKIKCLFILVLLNSTLIFSQSGWIVETINSSYNLEVLSYKDTNICQLVRKFELTGGLPKVIISTNGTSSWIESDIFAYGIKDVQFLNASTGFLMYWAHNSLVVQKTNNYGMNWSSGIYSSITVSSYDNIYFTSPVSGFLWGEAGIIKTTNLGANWNSASFSPVTNYTRMYFISRDTGFLSGTNSITSSPCIARTTNFGVNWVPTDISNSCLKIDFVDANTGYAICTGSKFLKTTNQGINWQVNTIDPAENLISLSFVNANTGYLLSQSLKILKTTNGGLNWSIQNLPQSGVSVRDVEFASVNRGIILCSGGKIMKTNSGGEVLGIQPIGNFIPEDYLLSQNYPNPFNPVTQINFDIPKPSYVNLVIYDQLGREIEHLVKNELNPGSYKYEWNASSYPSVIYFYKLQAGEFVETKKMVLIK